MEELAKSYSAYFQQHDISKEVQPICTSIDEMLNRLDEFESLMTIVKNDTSTTNQQYIPEINAKIDEFKKLCNTIDNLEHFMKIVNENMCTLESHVQQAEEDLGINDLGIKGLLKPIFGKSKKKTNEATTTNHEPYAYEPPVIFQTSDYFPDAAAVDVNKLE